MTVQASDVPAGVLEHLAVQLAAAATDATVVITMVTNGEAVKATAEPMLNLIGSRRVG